MKRNLNLYRDLQPGGGILQPRLVLLVTWNKSKVYFLPGSISYVLRTKGLVTDDAGKELKVLHAFLRVWPIPITEAEWAEIGVRSKGEVYRLRVHRVVDEVRRSHIHLRVVRGEVFAKVTTTKAKNVGSCGEARCWGAWGGCGTGGYRSLREYGWIRWFNLKRGGEANRKRRRTPDAGTSALKPLKQCKREIIVVRLHWLVYLHDAQSRLNTINDRSGHDAYLRLGLGKFYWRYGDVRIQRQGWGIGVNIHGRGIVWQIKWYMQGIRGRLRYRWGRRVDGYRDILRTECWRLGSRRHWTSL
jgi:hypothetical protein